MKLSIDIGENSNVSEIKTTDVDETSEQNVLQRSTQERATVFKTTWSGTTIPKLVRTGDTVIVKRSTTNNAQSKRELRILQILMSSDNPYPDFFANMIMARRPSINHMDIILQYGGIDLHNYFLANGNWDTHGAVVDHRIACTTRALTGAMCALIKLHSLGLFHGDIKPENFVIDELTQHVRLIDFESSNIASKKECGGDKTTFCTVLYSHPRICAGATVNGFEADMWSFGQMAFTLYTGSSLLNIDSKAERHVRQTAFQKSFDWSSIYSQFIPHHLQMHRTFQSLVDFVDIMCAEYNPQRPPHANMLLLQHPFLCSWRRHFYER